MRRVCYTRGISQCCRCRCCACLIVETKEEEEGIITRKTAVLAQHSWALAFDATTGPASSRLCRLHRSDCFDCWSPLPYYRSCAPLEFRIKLFCLTLNMAVPEGPFSFDLCKRNAYLETRGVKAPGFTKTGTTIAGIIFKVC